MENSEKMLDVAEPTEEVAEETTEVDETPQEETTPDFADGAPTKNENVDEEPKTEQSVEENAQYASIRRKAEEEAKKKIESETRKAYEKGRLEAYKGKINPYTNKPISDIADIEVYEMMYKLEQDGKDPINDLPDELSNKKRAEQEKATQEKENQERANREVKEFQEKYPDVNLGELLQDSFFSDYIAGKNKSLVELYDGFNNFKNAFRNSAVNVAKQTIANSQSSPGSLGGGSEQPIVDYSTMSSEEFQRYVQRAKDGDLR